MRKALAIILSAILVTSCSFYTGITQNVKENPFMPSYDLSKALEGDVDIFNPETPEEPPAEDETPGDGDETVTPPPATAPNSDEPPVSGPESFSFALMTDPHIGRTDSGVTERGEEFLKFLGSDTEKRYDFVVCLGDLTDTGDIYASSVEKFIDDARKRTELNNFIYVIGNHDIRTQSKATWDEQFSVLTPDHDVSRMMRYSYKGVSIYKLDNSSRIFGKEQLRMLEEALRHDPNKYRIFLAHEVVTTGGELDQTLILFGSEAGELLRLYRIMRDYGVSMIFTGHHHKGNVIYEGDYFAEFNAAALHTRSGSFESDGYAYSVDVDPVSETIKVTAYVVTGEEESEMPWRETATYSFILHAADEVGKEPETDTPEEQEPYTPPESPDTETPGDTENGGDDTAADA